MSEPVDILLCRDIFILFSDMVAAVNVKSCRGELEYFKLSLTEENKRIDIDITSTSITIRILYNRNELQSYFNIREPPPGKKYVDILSRYNETWKKLLDKFIKNYNEDSAREIAQFIVTVAKEIISKYIAFLPNITLTVFFDQIEAIVDEKAIIIYDMQLH